MENYRCNHGVRPYLLGLKECLLSGENGDELMVQPTVKYRCKDSGLPDRAPNRTTKDLQVLLEVILPVCVLNVSLG